MMSEPRKLTYEDHRRQHGALKYVYPVLSRRAKGISIGINLNPDKVCNFDCAYCQVDRRVPGGEGLDLAVLRGELEQLLREVAEGHLFTLEPFDAVNPSLQRVNDLCFSGDGEPTTVPTFLEAVTLAAQLKTSFGLEGVKLVLITNASMLHRPRVQEALTVLDAHQGEVWAKLDAGTEAYYRRVSGSRIPFRRILENIGLTARGRPIVIQTLFMEQEEGPPSPAELEAWLSRLETILAEGGRLKLIQVYSIARQPPRGGLYSLSDPQLDDIVALARGRLKVPVEAYYGSSRYLRPLVGL